MDNIKQWSISYRPQKISDVYGASSLKTWYKACVEKDEWPRGILLTGKYGTGKTTIAQIIAKAMVCKHLDSEGNPCNQCPDCMSVVNETFGRDIKMCGPEDLKSDKDSVVNTVKNFISSQEGCFYGSKRKVIIFEEVQELAKQSPAALNALLKTLEKKQSKVFWIFTAMDPMKGSGITSRLQTFNFYEQSNTDILKYLVDLSKRVQYEGTTLWNWMLKNAGKSDEEIKTFITKGLLEIAKCSEGSLRTATQLLEQVILTKTFTIESIQARFGSVSEDDVMEVFFDIANNTRSDKVIDLLSRLDNSNYMKFYYFAASYLKEAEMAKCFGKIKKYKSKLNKETGETTEVIETLKEGDWSFDKSIQLTKSPNYEKLRNLFISNNLNSNYLSKDIFITQLLSIYN